MAIASPHSLDIGATAAWLVDGARSASNSQDVLAELGYDTSERARHMNSGPKTC